METQENWREAIANLKAQIAEIESGKQFHPDFIARLKKSLDSLEEMAADFDRINAVAADIEKRLLDPVREQQKLTNRIGFIVGAVGILVSIAAVVSTVFITSNTRQEVKTFTESSLVELIETRAGHQAIAEEVAKSVLDSDLYYADFSYDATLTHLTAARWTEDQKRDYLRVNADMRKVVHNPSDQTKQVALGIQLFNLDNPDPDPSQQRMTYEELHVERIDRLGNRVGVSHYRRDDLLEHVAGGGDASKLVPPEAEIPPGGRVEMRMRTTSFEKLHNGQIFLLADRKTVTMTMMVNFPVGESGRFLTNVFPAARGCFFADDKCQVEQPPETPYVRAEINGGLLPLNGIFLSWDFQ